jgi:membrane-bound serine protease (ClpP class)
MNARKIILLIAFGLLVLGILYPLMSARASFETAGDGEYASLQAQPAHVDVAVVNGVIDTFMEGYLDRVVKLAESDGASALVIRMDTPGGELESTRKMIENMLNTSVPSIVYVSPSGARAGSAGVFLTYAANLAAMAPGTNIGAAHPVGQGGQDITGTIGIKVTNDAVAFIRTIAQQRGRNVEWAERAVRESVSITEKEALELNVINFISPNLTDLLNQLDGRTTTVNGRETVLRTRGAEIRTIEMNFFESFFHILLDPNIASIFLSVGSLAILVELYNPGATIPAVVGVICLTLAAVALLGLPTNWAAVILILAGFGMLVLDIKVTGFALSVGGVMSVILGLFFLFRPFTLPQQPQFDISVSPWVIAGITGVIALFFFVILRAALSSRRLPAVMGAQTYIGAHGVAVTDIQPQGTVHVRSEQWTAESEEPIVRGDKIVVVGVDGLRVKVKKA